MSQETASSSYYLLVTQVSIVMTEFFDFEAEDYSDVT